MVKPRTTKRDEILNVAAELFATKPFHEVRLEDIAAQAGVGKGTVYLHWTSKEDVYLAIIRRGFGAVLERIDEELLASQEGTWGKVAAIVDALVDFAFTYPEVYRLMRTGTLTPEDPGLQRVRADVVSRIVGVLRQGIANGELDDPCPALTAQYILSFVRGAILYPPASMTRRSLKKHMLHVLQRGIADREEA